MDTYILLGGALGAALRKLNEWAGDRMRPTAKGAVVEILVGAGGALIAVKLGMLPEAVLGPMLATPTGAVVLAGAASYVPLDVLRRFGDLVDQAANRTGLVGRIRTTAWLRWR